MENENIIVTRTFSKFYGIAALRLGYLICTKKIHELIDPYINQKDVNSLAIVACMESLK
jgi:histidinol-phosphate aminotransferase